MCWHPESGNRQMEIQKPVAILRFARFANARLPVATQNDSFQDRENQPECRPTKLLFNDK